MRAEAAARLIFLTPLLAGPRASRDLEWFAFGLGVILFAAALAFASPRFGYAFEVSGMPVLAFAGGLATAGLAYFLFLPRLVSAGTEAGKLRLLTLWIVAAGLAARLVLFASEPILEDDYQRYLWDGAVTANGFNPYAVAPEEALEFRESPGLAQLARDSGLVIERINHPEFRTIYPPVAQGAFALAYVIKPWSLASWRAVVLGCDVAALALLLLLLHACGRSPLWAALYWWNPVVIKELGNSAHMDAVVAPLLLSALWLAIRGRNVAAAAVLAFAAGAKIWPVLLLPLILRPLFQDARKLALALLVFGGLLALMAAPILAAPFGETSGFAAYIEKWRTNSALFPVLEGLTGFLLGALGAAQPSPGLAARMGVALVLGACAIWVCRSKIESADDLMGRAAMLVAVLVLLSPAQFPWYAVWLAPFLAFRPWTGFLLLTATIPLYYAGFHFLAREQRDMLAVIPWLVWTPVWMAIAWEMAKNTGSSAWRAANGQDWRPTETQD